MKRSDLVRHLTGNGCQLLREGGRHSIFWNPGVEFQVLASTLPPTAQRVLRDQLERANVSIVLNTAEGCGRRARLDRAHFFAMARGSAMECAAIVNLALVRDLAPYLDCRRGRSLLVRIVQMLTKLQLTMRGRL